MKKNFGFTLIELLIVILIIGILASVAVPMMTSVLDKAKWSECVSVLGVIRESCRRYYSQYNIYPNDITASVILNGPAKYAYPQRLRLDIAVDDPTPRASFIYVLYTTEGLGNENRVSYGFLDENNNGQLDSGERLMRILTDGRIESDKGGIP